MIRTNEDLQVAERGAKYGMMLGQIFLGITCCVTLLTNTTELPSFEFKAIPWIVVPYCLSAWLVWRFTFERNTLSLYVAEIDSSRDTFTLPYIKRRFFDRGLVFTLITFPGVAIASLITYAITFSFFN